jgi:hypothetical protein
LPDFSTTIALNTLENFWKDYVLGRSLKHGSNVCWKIACKPTTDSRNIERQSIMFPSVFQEFPDIPFDDG